MFSLETVKDLQHLLRSMGPWAALTAWTPKLRATTTDPDLGNGSATGQYSVIGGWCFGWTRIQFGSSGVNAGSSWYWVPFPVPPHPDVVGSLGAGAATIVGSGYFRRTSDPSANRSDIIVQAGSSTGMYFFYGGSANPVSHEAPWAWAANDRISFQFAYPVDPDWTP